MIKSPLEWYFEKYCVNCKNRKCESKSSTIYMSKTDYNGKIFCALAALMMLQIDNESLKEFGRKGGNKQ